MAGITSPAHLILGRSASLQCNYRLHNSSLYSVKWYKDGREFYRYMPGLDRQFEVFSVPGVNIEVITGAKKNFRTNVKIDKNKTKTINVCCSTCTVATPASTWPASVCNRTGSTGERSGARTRSSLHLSRCEVSNEFPDFHTVSQSVHLKVVGEC